MDAKGGRPVRVALIIIALMLAEITCSLETSLIFAALPKLYEIYGDPVQIGWLITGFTLTSAASAAIGGRIADLFGRRRVLIILLLVSTIGGLVSSLASDLSWVLVGRLLQGATTAILPICYGILREHVPKEKLAFGVAVLGATYSLSSGVSVMLGGVVVQYASTWQAIFYVSVGAGVIATMAVFGLIPADSRTTRTDKLDWLGGVLFVPALVMLFLGVSRIGALGGLGQASMLIAAGLLLLFVWAWYELRHKNPLLDLRLLANWQVALANGAIFFTAAGPMLAPAALLPLLGQPRWTGAGLELSPSVAGSVMMFGTFVSALAVVVGGIVAKRIGTVWVLLTGSLMSMTGWLALAFWHSTAWLVIGDVILLLAAGAALIFALAPHIIIEASPSARTAEATGVTQTIRALGLAVGSQMIAMCLASELVSRPGETGRFPANEAYTLLYFCIFGTTVLAALAVVALLMRRRRLA